MTRQISLEYSVATAVEPSKRVMQTAAMFGLGVDDNRSIKIVPQCIIPLPPASVIFITGPSGSGKTTILRLIGEKTIELGLRVIRFDKLPELPDQPLVDAFDLPLKQVTALLALAGMGDAFVMLRKPSQLSDGQRYRLRLAQMFSIADRSDSSCIILADEFGATLDRLTAKIIARNAHRWVSKSQHTFIVATTHDDLLEALGPSVLVVKELDENIEVLVR